MKGDDTESYIYRVCFWFNVKIELNSRKGDAAVVLSYKLVYIYSQNLTCMQCKLLYAMHVHVISYISYDYV
jgi:hypothetical protein